MPPTMNSASVHVLFLGNFLSSVTGTMGPSELLTERLQARGWHIQAVGRSTNRWGRLFERLHAVVFQWARYDVACIEVYSGDAFTWAEATALMLRLLGKPFILSLQGGNLPDFGQSRAKRVRRLLNIANVVVTPSRRIQQAFLPLRADIMIMPNMLDLSAYPFRQRVQASPRMGWLRAFHRVYSPVTAVEALAQVMPEYPSVQLVMIGPDKHDGSFEVVMSAVQEFGLENHITFPGRIAKDAIPSLLGENDIFLNTTTAESFGVSVMEAAALGMCIITTDAGELRYLWTDGYDALLVPPEDADALALAMRRILEDPGLSERLSRNARATAERYDVATLVPEWERLLVATVSGRTR